MIKNKVKKIGILGGTFNPIHNGHIMITRVAKKALNLDQV
jgi:nicotinate-nucleotide adenylyltransferase